MGMTQFIYTSSDASVNFSPTGHYRNVPSSPPRHHTIVNLCPFRHKTLSVHIMHDSHSLRPPLGSTAMAVPSHKASHNRAARSTEADFLGKVLQQSRYPEASVGAVGFGKRPTARATAIDTEEESTDGVESLFPRSLLVWFVPVGNSVRSVINRVRLVHEDNKIQGNFDAKNKIQATESCITI